MRRSCTLVSALAAAAVLLVGAGAASGGPPDLPGKPTLMLSEPGVLQDAEFGLGVTQCPQAGIKPEAQPRPLNSQPMDRVERISNTGDDQRMNVEYFCFPQDETDIDVNPTNQRNAVGGANDYRMGWGTSGFYATTDNGNTWYGGVLPFPSVPDDDHIDGGGDPVIVFDREGVVYYSHLQFERETDRNGLFVNRSTNGGFTWSRPCVPIGGAPGGPPPDEGAVCGGPGDPRPPGDGMVTFHSDPDRTLNFSEPFDDKEWMEAGPRPAGVEPVCFTAVGRTPTACAPETVGVDRLYVTWTRFAPGGLFGFTARIMISFSDDQGRSWSPARAISGGAPFCGFSATGECDLNQFSVPTVHPKTGLLGVAFQNFNTPDESQYLFVRSRDGGVTFEGPFFVTPVYDVNYPRAGAAGGRPDCTARGQQSGRNVLTNSCFRVNSGGNVVVDPRGGGFADDFYLVMSDNRHGTRTNTNTETFLFKSNDGGTTWIGPTRVNDDASGNDQWFPWTDIGSRGDLNVNFYDRRLDPDSVAHEWPASRGEPGNYLVWRFGGICSITRADSTQCLAPDAAVIPAPAAPTDFPDPPLADTQTVFPFKNFSISDVPSNWDYCFRAGIFCGDYDTVAVGPDNQAWAVWTDARNGRSSRQQAGRNPACEQSDAFVDLYSARSGGSIGQAGSQFNELFLVTPCPTDIQDAGGG